MAPTGLTNSLLAAIQASLSVLLVISYGGVAAHLGLLTSGNTKAISKICVRMFLPALLFTQIGSELHADSATRYLIIFMWALICHFVSFIIGVMGHIWFGMPDWTTVALMFNNTTSYPLLLISALDETGILQSLLVNNETTRAAVERAKSYFLVFATVSSCLTFAVGPRLIDTEHAPEASKDHHDDDGSTNNAAILEESNSDTDEQTTLLQRNSSRHADPFAQNSFLPSNRRRSVAPSSSAPLNRRLPIVPKTRWLRLSPRSKWWLLFVADFFNAPLLGAIVGVIVGLIPALHRAFFNDTPDGGVFTAWLTSSLRSIGGLFVPLPVLVAGVSLYTAARDAKQQSASNQVGAKFPWLTVAFILVLRFVVWPVASIAAIYLVASRTDLLGPDAMLWFAMMLMPTGPPAMKLITLVQVSDAGEEEEASIAQLLTISYLISPILSLTVVGSLKASQQAMLS